MIEQTVRLQPWNSVKPSTYNPRTADEQRLELIELSLRKLGWLIPIYADGAEIVSGHQRHLVAGRIGLDIVPVTPCAPMTLHNRQAINIAYNRGTNDMDQGETPADLAAALRKYDVQTIAADMPDVDWKNEREAYPCAFSTMQPLERLIQANQGSQWNASQRNMTRNIVKRAGTFSPVIVTPDFRIVNGLGRAEFAAMMKWPTVPVIEITDGKAALARPMLNLLTMDFDIHNRYADILRHNSFRRTRNRRPRMGPSYIIGVTGSHAAKKFTGTPADWTAWRRIHGHSILDFGAGKLCETRRLRAQAIRVTPFEPYITGNDDKIIPEAGRAIVREFLADVAAGVTWTSIFCNHVMNSVPFMPDREHIVALLAECAYGSEAVTYIATRAASDAIQYHIGKARGVGELFDRMAIFKLDYEPGTLLAGTAEYPKIQKSFSFQEMQHLTGIGFDEVKIGLHGQNFVRAVCRQPRDLPWSRVEAAIRFEFELPYPDGTRIGLSGEALDAFRQRRKKLKRREKKAKSA